MIRPTQNPGADDVEESDKLPRDANDDSPNSEDGKDSEKKSSNDDEVDDADAENESDDVEAVCGDGVVEDGEECDDGNDVDWDGCSAECTVEEYYSCRQSGKISICQPVCGAGLAVPWLTVMTTFPRTCPCSRYRMASAASASGYRLSIAGITLPVSSRSFRKTKSF
jgi:cysteine-rich repeat protein